MKFSSIASLAVLFACASCGPGSQGWKSQPHERWTDSNYQLSQHESMRLRQEARRAQQKGNREVCGAILQRADGSLELCFADNESLHAHSYTLSSSSVRRMNRIAKLTDSTIIGSFHSHPSSGAQPGDGDLEGAGVLSLMLIHSVRTGETRLWKVVLREGKRKPARSSCGSTPAARAGPRPSPLPTRSPSPST
ncbi:MAG: Mov34/MPN/PAD-1 family protein [Roseibacillus sp.]